MKNKLQMNEERYIRKLEYKKSPVYLLPLVGLPNSRRPDTFLYAEGVDENIEDFSIMCYYETNSDKDFERFERDMLLSKDNLVNCYLTERGGLYVFSLCNPYSEEVLYFLDGKYSKFSEEAKKTICVWHKIYIHTPPKPEYIISMALYPELYQKEVEKEMMCEEGELDGVELCEKFDKEEETFKGNIIKELNISNQSTKYL